MRRIPFTQEEINAKTVAEWIAYGANLNVTHFYEPWFSVKGKDLTHHEPIEYISVGMSGRCLKRALEQGPLPKSFGQYPLRYVERKMGRADINTVVHIIDGKTGRERGSRGFMLVLGDNYFEETS